MEEKFQYFMDRTEEDLRVIREKLDSLITFRILLIGAAAAVSVIFSTATSLVVILISK